MNMKCRRAWRVVFAVVLSTALGAQSFAVTPTASELVDRLTNSSLAFTANKGQFPDHILYRASVPNATLWVTKTGMQYQFTRVTGETMDPAAAEMPIPDALKQKTQTYEQLVIATHLKGANVQPYAAGQNLLPGYSNYFLGNDKSKWVTDVPEYSSVALFSVYPGVDVYYYGANGQIEYDFSLAPGADPNQIQIAYEGIKSLHISDNGDLEVTTDWSTITQHKPVVYQEKNGIHIPLDAQYTLVEPNVVGFKLPDIYNPELALIIDPTIAYGTYIGGTTYDIGWDVAVDACQNAYLTGYTNSTNFPVSGGAYQSSDSGSYDIFVAKFNTKDSGSSTKIWSTYVGGSNTEVSEYAFIAVDGSSNSYVTGGTWSSDFPTTTGAWDRTFANGGGGGGDAFVFKLSPSGNSLSYSTYVGGSGNEIIYGLTIDTANHAYIAGYVYNEGVSDFYPYKKGIENNATTSTHTECVLTKLSANGDSVLYSTKLGGTGSTNFFTSAPDVDANEVVCVAGLTNSSDFDLAGAYQTSIGGSSDALVAIIDTKDSFNASLDYSSFFGGTGVDVGNGVVFDSNGDLILSGHTNSSSGFPIANAYQGSIGGSNDAFLAKIDPTAGAGGLIYSTYFGGIGNEQMYDMALDNLDHPIITGRTDSTGWPTVNAINGSFGGGGRDMVVAYFYDGDSVIFSSYLGGANYDASYGVAVDDNRAIYIAAKSNTSSLFGASVLSYTQTRTGDTDAVLIKIAPGADGSHCQPGDVNNDGVVDRNDSNYLSAYLFSGGPAPHCTSARINNCSATVNISDVTALLNYIGSCTAIGCSSCSCP